MRRDEVVGIFPDEAVTRVRAMALTIGAILLEQKGEWTLQLARHMTLASFAGVSEDAAGGVEQVKARPLPRG